MDSQTSEEDLVPPPLPVKHRDSDYGNLPEDSQYRGSTESYQFVNRPLPDTPLNDTFTNSHYEVLEIRNREVVSTKKNPPTPPPKPARTSKGPLSPL